MQRPAIADNKPIALLLTALPMTIDLSRTTPRLPRINGWTVTVWLIALLVASPILVVLGSVLSPSEGVFSHLASTVLTQYITHSLLLKVGVGVGVLVIQSAVWLNGPCCYHWRHPLTCWPTPIPTG